MKYDSEAFEKLRRRHEEEIREMQAEQALVTLLPDGIRMPVISNLNSRYIVPCTAVLSFTKDYGVDLKARAQHILDAFEGDGWKHTFVSMAKWNNYRPYPCPFHQNEVPPSEEDASPLMAPKVLKYADPVCPMWFEISVHTGTSVNCYYEKNHTIVDVSIEVDTPTSIYCRRMNFEGDWAYTGDVRVTFPYSWSVIKHNGVKVAQTVPKHTCGYKDTSQSISGRIFWNPEVGQDDFPMTPAQMFRALMAKSAEKPNDA